MASRIPSWTRNPPGAQSGSYVGSAFPIAAPCAAPMTSPMPASMKPMAQGMQWGGVAPATEPLSSLSMRPMPGYTAQQGRATLQQASGLGGSGWQPGRTNDFPPPQQPVKSWVPSPAGPTPTPTGPAAGFDWSGIDLLSKTTGAMPMPQTGLLSVPDLKCPDLQAPSDFKVPESTIPAPAAAPVAAPVVAPVPPARPAREGCVLRFNCSSSSRQHPSKQAQGIPNADCTEESPYLLGVCDGVSGCTKLGISPDLLPRELLTACRNKSRQWLGQTASRSLDSDRWIPQLMEEAYRATYSMGATTMLLGAIRDNGLLMTGNVGDCSLLVLRVVPSERRLQVIFKTTPTRYEATKPVQVQRLPNMPEARTLQVLQNAKLETCQLQPGDYLVLGSDGLYDNLQDSEIQEVIQRHLPLGSVSRTSVLAEAAEALVSVAIARASGQARDGCGPVDRESLNPDDTTALVAEVVEVPNTEEYDSWFWRSRGIRQPFQEQATSARVPSHNSGAPNRLNTTSGNLAKAGAPPPPPRNGPAARTRARSLEPPQTPLQDCTNMPGSGYEKSDALRTNPKAPVPSASNHLSYTNNGGAGAYVMGPPGGAAPDWWTKMQVPGKAAQPPKYGERGGLATQAAQTRNHDGVYMEEAGAPRLTSQVLRAHEAKMATAASIERYAAVPRAYPPPGQRPPGWGLPSTAAGHHHPGMQGMPGRYASYGAQSDDQCVIS